MTKEEIHFTDDMMLNQETAEAFYDYINPLPDKGRLLEIGYGFGHSTRLFSQLKPNFIIYSIDSFGLYGDGRIYQKLAHDKVKEVLEYNKDRNNIINILGDSSKVPWELPIDILYIDGNHTYTGCKTDFDKFSPFITQNGLIIFDDLIQNDNPSNGVAKVFYEIKGYKILYEGIAGIVKKL